MTLEKICHVVVANTFQDVQETLLSSPEKLQHLSNLLTAQNIFFAANHILEQLIIVTVRVYV